MVLKRINETDYANIYGIYDDDGKAVGSVEVKIAGREAGKSFCYSYRAAYNKRDIRRIFSQLWRAAH